MEKIYKTLHGANKKYTEKFNPSSEDEIFKALTRNMELVERKGIALRFSYTNYLPKNSVAGVNRIFGTDRFYGEMITPYHEHDFFEANYVYSGTLVECIDGEKHVLGKGDLLLVPPGMRHSNFPTTGSEAVNVILSSDFIIGFEKEMSKFGTSGYLSYLIKNKAFQIFRNTDKIRAGELVSQIYELSGADKSSAYCAFLKKNLAERLMARLSECERLDKTYFSDGDGGDFTQLSEKILKYINENYSSASIGDVSRTFGYTPQHIRRIILKATGMNFQMYVQSCRMGKSENLLVKTDIPINEIAEIVGLGSAEYFSRWFKFQHGESPAQYRRNHGGQQ